MEYILSDASNMKYTSYTMYNIHFTFHTVKLLTIKIQSNYTAYPGFVRYCVLYLMLSCHLLCLSVRQVRRPTSPLLVSSSFYWTQPLSCGISPCSTSKLLRYLCVICYFNLIRFKVERVVIKP